MALKTGPPIVKRKSIPLIAFVDDKDGGLRPGSSRITTPQTPKLQKRGYEVSATASASPYAPSASSQPLSAAERKSPRRPGSSIFRLLPFKRTFNDRASSSAESFSTRGARPQTPGADTSSIVPSLADSGTGGVPMGSLSKKKSGTFWGRRKSSLSLVVGVDEMGQMARQSQDQSTKNMQMQVTGLTNGRLGGYQNGADTEMGRVAAPDSIPMRPRSPPPQLPEVEHVLNGGGLMGGENWFAHIG
ncbi:MAG: hypothetical protein Q9167_004781 [Letrouitia subvulpina]